VPETQPGEDEAPAQPIDSAEPTDSDDGVEASDAVAAPSVTKAKVPAASKAADSGRATPKGRVPTASKTADSGRATPKGGVPGRQPVSSGRYTPPIPRQVRHSPRWFPFVLLGFLVLGLLMIVLNYVNVLPGGTNNWYLIGGIGAIVVGLFMATFYH
jgi:hypothetical protein